ncbi:MAG: Quinolinate synthase A [Phycisphaerae bacterium]|nr:Quinolinate synthase A [Phycisphaerae bacterium]
MLFQSPLPPRYHLMTDAEMFDAIGARKAALGRRLVILGHHYQADDVVRFADFTGDSYKLSRQAASEAADAEFIVFCGVHFMAESADILTRDKIVVLPDLSAGCSMADMADIDQVREAWYIIAAATDATVVPITYVNSSAAVKAFVGEHGGTCCTSSNADRALAWALGRGSKVIFLPDQHLGRNTAYAMGHPLESMAVWDPHQLDGGLTDGQIRDATFILWKGHCSVHQLFRPEHIDQVRADRPGVRVIVHPECDWAVVQKADLSGSTERIVHTIEQAEPGSEWAVGTEIHLVKRLADRFRGVKHVQSLSDCQCLCTTMYRIDPRHLLWVLDELAAGRVVNRIVVPPDVKRGALLALEQMLRLPGKEAATASKAVK